jgi:hypothetical protein
MIVVGDKNISMIIVIIGVGVLNVAFG